MSYRQKLKITNPEKYLKYLEQQRQRSKRYRDGIKNLTGKEGCTEEEKRKVEKYKEGALLRQNKHRAKLRALAEHAERTDEHPSKRNPGKKKKAKTRTQKAKQREYWRKTKARWRANLSGQKKRRIKEKDKAKKREMRALASRSKSSKIYNTLLVAPSAFGSKQTLYNRASAAKKALPKTPEKFAEVFAHIANNTTPRKRKAIMARTACRKKLKWDFTPGASPGEQLHPNQGNDFPTKTAPKHRSKKNIATRLLARSIKVANRKKLSTTNHTERKKRSDAISNSTARLVQEFFLRISRPLPNKRYATKNGPAYLMGVTLKRAHRMFLLDHSTVKISFSKFCSLRPRNVRLLSRAHWQHCVCTTCQNIKYR